MDRYAAKSIESALECAAAAWPFTIPVATLFPKTRRRRALLTGSCGANADGLRCNVHFRTEYIGAEGLLEQLPLKESIDKSLERRGDDDDVQDEEDMDIDEIDGS